MKQDKFLFDKGESFSVIISSFQPQWGRRVYPAVSLRNLETKDFEVYPLTVGQTNGQDCISHCQNLPNIITNHCLEHWTGKPIMKCEGAITTCKNLVV